MALISKVFGSIVSDLKQRSALCSLGPVGRGNCGALGPFHLCLSPLPELSRAEVLEGVTIVTGGNWPECESVGTAATAFEVFTLND